MGIERSVTFDGFWTENNVGEAPKKAGVFCVYKRGLLKSARRLLFIGEIPNAKNIGKHKEIDAWREALGKRERLNFTFAPVKTKKDRLRIADALIFANKPELNSDDAKNNFSEDETTVQVDGKATGLASPSVAP